MDRVVDGFAQLIGKYGKAFLSVGLALLLVLSTVNVAAFAENASLEEGSMVEETEVAEETEVVEQQEPAVGEVSQSDDVTVSSEESDSPEPAPVAENESTNKPATQETQTAPEQAPMANLGEAIVSLKLHDAFIKVNGQSFEGTSITLAQGKDFTFEAHPNTGFSLTKVWAEKAGSEIALSNPSGDGVTYVLVGQNVASDTTLIIETTPDPGAEQNDSSATVIEDASEVVVQNEGEGTVDESDEGTHVVTFYSQGEVYTPRIVENGTTVEAPENPPIPEGMSSFAGWYTTDDETGILFDFSTVITGSLELHARFSDQYLVSFKTSADSSGTIYHTQHVSRGERATMPANPTSEGYTFQFWYIEGLEEPSAFDFSSPIYGNITLVPQFGSGYYIIFESNGGSDVDHQVVIAGNSATEPEKPTRKGYEFAFWSTDINADSSDAEAYAYDFTDDVTESITLYAIWKGEKVGYTVNVYNEIANIAGDPGYARSNYELVTSFPISSSDALAGTAGQKIDVAAFETYMNTYFTSRKYSSAGANVYDLLDYSKYAWTDADSKTIAGSGRSVINVYAKRISYEMVFSLTKSSKGTHPIVIGTKDGTTYGGSDSGMSTYSIQMKLGQDIGDIWPYDYSIPSQPTYKFVNFNGWHGLSKQEAMFASKSYIRMGYSTDTSQGSKSGRLDNATPVTMVANVFVAQYKEVRYYYTEASQETIDASGAGAFDIGGSTSIATDGNAKTFLDNPDSYALVKFNGVYYENAHINTVPGNYQSSWSPKNWPGKDINGFESIGQNNSNFPKYRVSNYQVAIADRKLSPTFNNGMVDNDTVSLGSIVYFMPRKSYVLTLSVGDARVEGWQDAGFVESIDSSGNAIYTKQVAYQENLGIENLRVNGETAFTSWFKTDDYGGQITNPADETMPAAALTLYAGFEGKTQEITYYNKVGGEAIEVQTVPKGATTTGSSRYEIGEGVEGFGEFMGWGYMIPGTNILTEYNFDLAVNSDQTLYALWNSGPFKITYEIEPGTGEAPVDPESYGLGAKALLKDGSGIVAPDEQSFIGWQKKGSSVIYYPGPSSAVTMWGNTTMNAYYVPVNTNFVSVTFDPNGGNGSAFSLTTIAKTVMMLQPDGTFTRDGYRLVGWSRTDGEHNQKDYDLGAEYTVPYVDTTLYAVWEEIPTYTITFEVSDPSMGYLDDDKDQVVYSIRADQTFTSVVSEWPQATAKDGYYFVEWSPAEYKNMYVHENLLFTASFAAVINPQVVIGDGSKTYGNDDPNPLSTESIVLYDGSDEILSYQAVEGDLERASGEDVIVGGYAITLTDQGIEHVNEALQSAGKAPQYRVADESTVTAGTFVINPRLVKLLSNDDEKSYDGFPLTGKSVEVSGDGFVSGEGADYRYTASIEFPGSTPNVFEYDLTTGTKAENYTIECDFGTLKITKGSLVTDASIEISVGSATKIYDGTALEAQVEYTNAEGALEVTINGLPEGHTIENLVLNGSVTNAGTAVAGVESYVIRNQSGTDVTDLFRDEPGAVTVNNGLLTVQARSLTLTSASDEKWYDGTALTNNEVTVSGDGFIAGEGFTANVTGTITDPVVGGVANVFTYTLQDGTVSGNYRITTNYGILTILTIDSALTIWPESASKMYDGTPLVASAFGYDGLEAGHRIEVAAYGGSATNATGQTPVAATISQKDITIYEGDIDITKRYSNIVLVDGALEVGRRPVEFTSGSASAEYREDLIPLTNNEVTQTINDAFLPMVKGEEFAFTVTGEARYAGQKTYNTFRVNDEASSADSGNYEINYVFGELSLTIADAEVSITVNGAAKTYDGTPLMPNSITVEGLEAGYTVEVLEYAGTITNVSENNTPSAVASIAVDASTGKPRYVITDAAGIDVTDHFTKVEITDGLLTIMPAEITLISGDASKNYDGTPLMKEDVAVEGILAIGDELIFDNFASIAEAGERVYNRFNYAFSSGDPRNYEVTVEFGILEIGPIEPGTVIPGRPPTGDAGDTPPSTGSDVPEVVVIIAETLAAPIVALEDAFGVPETNITENETPFASRTGCWVHWYILLGAIITAVYTASVVIRRRNFAAELKAYEDGALGDEDNSESGVESFRPAPQGT